MVSLQLCKFISFSKGRATHKKNIGSVMMIIPRCFLINFVIRYIMKQILVSFGLRFLPKNMIDGRNKFQEIRWEKQDLQVDIY